MALPQSYASTAEVSLRFGWHPNTVRARVRDGSFRAFKDGRKLRIDLASVESWVATRVVIPNVDATSTHIAGVIESFPPLSSAQRARLEALLRAASSSSTKSAS